MPLVLNIISAVMLILALAFCILTFKNRLGFLSGVIASTGGVLLSGVASIYRLKILTGADVITETINESFDIIKDSLMQSSNSQLSQVFDGVLGGLDGLLEGAKQMYLLLFPSILILNTLAFVFIFYMLLKQMLRLFKKDVSMYPSFSQLILRRSAAVAFAISYIAARLTKNAVSAAALQNISAVLGGVAFICGFSFIDFKLRQRLKNAWTRVAVYIAAVFIASAALGFIGLVFIAIALSDAFADYRRLRVAKANPQ